MSTVAETLVGRTAEIGSLDRFLAAIDAGGGSLAVEVVGEPGIGKTRLLSELADRADALGYLVLSGSASELERDLPFGVFVDALDEYLQGLERDRLDVLDDDVRNALANVFPSLSGLATTRGEAFRHERYRGHRAVREVLERLTAARPLVLLLDDIHWADSASIDLLGALLRRPPDAAVLLVVALRPRQAPERLTPALEPARRSGTLTRLELGALSRVESVELLGEAFDEATAVTLYEESGGNPFYLEQLGRVAGRKTPRAVEQPEDSLRDLDVPPLVAAALAEELALLPEESRLLLRGAAVAGDPFDPELATAAAACRGRRGTRCGGRAASSRRHSRDRSTPPLSLSASAGSARGIRNRPGRLAARGSRAVRSRACGPRCRPCRARTSRRARRTAGRRGRGRDIAGRRERRGASSSSERCTLVCGRASTSRRRRAGRRARRAAARTRRSVGQLRTFRRSPCRVAEDDRGPSGGGRRTARSAHDCLRGRRASPRLPPGRVRSPGAGAGRPRGRQLPGSGGAHDRARARRRLPDGVRADRALGAARTRARQAARRSRVDCERRRPARLGGGPVRQGCGRGEVSLRGGGARRLTHGRGAGATARLRHQPRRRGALPRPIRRH